MVLLVSLFLARSTLAIDVQELVVDEAFFHSLCIYWFQKKMNRSAPFLKKALFFEEASVEHMNNGVLCWG